VRRVAASVPLAVVLLDVTAVAVLVPDIRLGLGSSSSGGQWVLNAYLLAVAALLPLLAALASRTSARALAAAGALAMATGAVVGATADSTAVLVAGRAIQGAGAAALLACAAGALLAGARRNTLAVLPALAFALGPLVGGLFAEQNWWRVFLWAGVPLAALAGAAALAAPRPEVAPRPGDAGLLAFAAGLVAITIALVQMEAWSWGWWALSLLGGAVLMTRAPLNPVRGAAMAWAASAGCLAGLLFVIPEYFQLARNLSGLRSGTLLLPVTFSAVAAWALSRRLTARIPPVALTIAGLACAGVALAVLGTIDSGTRYAVLIAVLGIAGAGLGAAGGAARALPTGESPLGLAASALAGAALGLAAVGAAFQSAQADERATGASFEHALAAGVGWAALFLLAPLAGAALMVWRLRTPSEAVR
jgi:DHA2 family methylenomycin A resistance protein-like MFS transporter